MSAEIINDQLTDANNNTVGLVSLQKKNNYYIGKFTVVDMPIKLGELLDLYNNCVEDNILSLLDSVQREIGEYKLRLSHSKLLVKEIRLVGDEIYLEF